MSPPRMIEGHVEEEFDVTAPSRVVELENEIRGLRRQLEDARVEAQRAREDAARALGALRRQLSPLYRALQAIFGELDAAGLSDTMMNGPVPDAPPPTQRKDYAIWASWKEKLGPSCGRIIDVLLLHGDLNQQQIAMAAHMHRKTAANNIGIMSRAGLISRNGSRISLKSL